MMILGLQASAMAIMMRWRMPPESSCGNISQTPSALAMPTICTASMVRWRISSGVLPSPSCRAMTSSTWSPMRKTGLSDVMGSWKIIEIMLPRRCCMCSCVILVMSYALSPRFRRIAPETIWPCGRCRSCMSESEVTDLPQPDSPTTPTTLPCGTSKLTPSTLRTVPLSVKK